MARTVMEDVRATRVRLPDGSDVRLPDIHVPEVRLPDIRLPDIALPDIRVPEVSVPDLRVPDVSKIRPPDLTSVSMPDVPKVDWSNAPFLHRRTSRRPVAVGLALGAGLGAAAAYFLDPDRGRGRRIQAADRLAASGRRARRAIERWLRTAGAIAAGRRRQLTELAARPGEPPDDTTLAHTVESELFRDRDIPKGDMNINAENGVVILRGIADSDDQIERITARVMTIKGVRAVRS
ncbi:MAG TPA: BON domain-containing protein, partial [Candidatus Limnocylindrales bacterium]